MGRVYKMKALCLVAHPDDCVIFGWGFMRQYAEWDWTIAYLTYEENHPRALELSEFWIKRNVSTIFGGANDSYAMVLVGQLGFDANEYTDWINNVIADYDIILTHNHLGEYGHPHHKFINSVVSLSNKPIVYFGNHPEYVNHYILETEKVNLKELPLHKNVIESIDKSVYKYYITDKAKPFIRNETAI